MAHPKQLGFSLVEMLVATLLFSTLTAGVLGVVSNTYRRYTNERAGQDLTWQGRAAVDLMVRELRQAGYPAENTYSAAASITSSNSNLVATTFVVAASTQVIFEADVDGSGTAKRVEYRLSGTTLQRSAVTKNSDGTVPAAQYDNLATNVNNGAAAIFTYTTDPQSTLAAPGNTMCVQIALPLKSAIPDPKNGRYLTVNFQGLACRQNPD